MINKIKRWFEYKRWNMRIDRMLKRANKLTSSPLIINCEFKSRLSIVKSELEGLKK